MSLFDEKALLDLVEKQIVSMLNDDRDNEIKRFINKLVDRRMGANHKAIGELIFDNSLKDEHEQIIVDEITTKEIISSSNVLESVRMSSVYRRLSNLNIYDVTDNPRQNAKIQKGSMRFANVDTFNLKNIGEKKYFEISIHTGAKNTSENRNTKVPKTGAGMNIFMNFDKFLRNPKSFTLAYYADGRVIKTVNDYLRLLLVMEKFLKEEQEKIEQGASKPTLKPVAL